MTDHLADVCCCDILNALHDIGDVVGGHFGLNHGVEEDRVNLNLYVVFRDDHLRRHDDLLGAKVN